MVTMMRAVRCDGRVSVVQRQRLFADASGPNVAPNGAPHAWHVVVYSMSLTQVYEHNCTAHLSPKACSYAKQPPPPVPRR